MPSSDLLKSASAALERQEFDRAEQLAALIPRTSPQWHDGLVIAGEAATKSGRLQAALQHYRDLAESAREPGRRALGNFHAAEVYRELGQLTRAEQTYRAVLLDEPQNVATHERLAFLLAVTGRRWEALPHYWALVRSGSATIPELVVLGDLDRPLEHRSYLQSCAEKAPEDALVHFGLAAHDYWAGESDRAESSLRRVLPEMPTLLSGQAMLGELLVDADRREFLEWHGKLPEEASGHPDIWHVRGLWARRHNELPVAVHCFRRAVELAPTHRRATYHLGQVLTTLKHEAAADFHNRAKQLIRLTQLLDEVLLREPLREAPVRETAELLEQLGRVWEACGWAVAAQRAFPNATWPQATFDRLAGMLDDDLPLVRRGAILTTRHDLGGFGYRPELFEEEDASPGHPAKKSEPASASFIRRSEIRFVEESAAVGIDFAYNNGADPQTQGARMFEQTGGGAAVLDMDLDGWPDLYFSQGGDWDTGAASPAVTGEEIDRLYRNVPGRFADVTRRCGLGDERFSQGPSVGDFDNDGFPDLYLANIGRNRLYRNNGDGTFSEVTSAAGLELEDWTVSCAIVDLNADGLPDLFDVNYVTGPRVYEAICGGKACSPKVFRGVPDRLHLNQGDGRFELATVAMPEQDAKGLGLLAFAMDQPNRPCLFIANDQVANFFLKNHPSDDSYGVRFENAAFLSGLAYNENGLAMACMGVAAGDVDGNGLLDVFVTNFHNESNTLYLQDTAGLFVDGTNPAGLTAASWPFVGWGTQFLDADLDGQLDLVVTNGHVDDYRDVGGEFHMRPQFFRNAGGGRFVELMSETVGEWFAEKHLGRGLARLDWNRDGRMDFVVSQIGERAALLTNRTQDVGHFLNVELHATGTARDAIGTVVEVTAEDTGRLVMQLTAGDGYQASNERVLQFGLGKARRVETVTVRWPSGGISRLHAPPVDTTIQIVEPIAPQRPEN